MARLNVQGLARRDKGLMSCILSDEGRTTVSIDLSAGEPTVTAHFSQDKNYRYATFEGVGKPPHYKDGVLMVDDIYLMTMSVSPVGRERMYKAFHYDRYGCEVKTVNVSRDRSVDVYTSEGLSFVEAWMKDPDLVKKALKKERELHKMLALALGYGMGPKKMVKQCYDKGYQLDLKTAREFYKAYWELFAGVRRLSDKLGLKIKRDGYIVNPFGYRLCPAPHKALNYYIQSSVSGIMHVFNAKLFTIAPYADFVTVIHDEVLADVPDDRLEDFRRHKDVATDSLNADLKWTTQVRTGFATGKTWYEAK